MKRRMLLFIAAILLALPGCNNSNWSSGDRVLVAKFLYEAEVADPSRFQVVVFKYPKGPLEKNVPKNYIKRLWGLPGEILAIFFGRIFHVPAPEPGQPPFFDDVAKKEINPDDLWQSPYTHANDIKSNERFDQGSAGGFEIVRKTPDVMMALRRIVYDNDFPAKDLVGPKWQRWLPSKTNGWLDKKDTSFAHQGASKESVDWLRYRHILRPLDSHEPLAEGRPPELITDFMGYNSFFEQDFQGHEWSRLAQIQPNWVGDLMLECKLTVTKAEGEFLMELSKGINRFQARWDLGSGMCTLSKIGQDGKKVDLDAKPTRVKSAGSYLLRFANIDARLTVWVDRDLPFENGHSYPPPEIRGPGEAQLDEAALHARHRPTKNDLQPASIGSKGAAVTIHNLKLWRDTYYTQNANAPGCDINDPPLAAADWSDPSKWDAFKKMPYKTMYVQPGHYLCLGDNSQQSSDSRDWGLVPKRLMLGRALLVYYPFNRAGAIR